MQSLGSIACKWDILFVVKCLEKTEKSEEKKKLMVRDGNVLLSLELDFSPFISNSKYLNSSPLFIYNLAAWIGLGEGVFFHSLSAQPNPDFFFYFFESFLKNKI
jgi:hypothetical protein